MTYRDYRRERTTERRFLIMDRPHFSDDSTPKRDVRLIPGDTHLTNEEKDRGSRRDTSIRVRIEITKGITRCDRMRESAGMAKFEEIWSVLRTV